MKGRSDYITRVSVDLTHAQREVLDQIIERHSQAASEAAGITIRLGMREFFHLLLKRHATSLDIDWPEDYPLPGGWRGGSREHDGKDE